MIATVYCCQLVAWLAALSQEHALQSMVCHQMVIIHGMAPLSTISLASKMRDPSCMTIAGTREHHPALPVRYSCHGCLAGAYVTLLQCIKVSKVASLKQQCFSDGRRSTSAVLLRQPAYSVASSHMIDGEDCLKVP